MSEERLGRDRAEMDYAERVSQQADDRRTEGEVRDPMANRAAGSPSRHTAASATTC